MILLVRAKRTLLVLALTLSACGGPTPLEQQAIAPIALPADTPTALPATAASQAPQPTTQPDVPRLGNDIRVAGVDVSGLPVNEARSKIEEALAPLWRA